MSVLERSVERDDGAKSSLQRHREDRYVVLTLTPSNPDVSPGWLLGVSPLAHGNTLTAVALGVESVYVFFRPGGLWTEQGELNQSSVARFAPDKGLAGGVIAMDGRRVVVTEHSYVGPREDAIAFTRGDAGWVATTRLRRANLLECSGIGVDVSLAIVGKLVVAGCPNAPTPHSVFEGKVTGGQSTRRSKTPGSGPLVLGAESG